MVSFNHSIPLVKYLSGGLPVDQIEYSAIHYYCVGADLVSI